MNWLHTLGPLKSGSQMTFPFINASFYNNLHFQGQGVRDLMIRFDVHIVLSSAEVQEDIIKISGTPANVHDAKEALLERVKELEEMKKDRELKSYTLQIEVNPDYHPKIIGKRGAVITKIRKDHDVQIIFPKKGKL